MKKGCIIVAGGKGIRMGGPLPKQYMEIADIPILMRTIRAFRSYDEHLKVVVCVPADDIEIVQGMVSRYIGDMKDIYIVSGGGDTYLQCLQRTLCHACGCGTDRGARRSTTFCHSWYARPTLWTQCPGGDSPCPMHRLRKAPRWRIPQSDRPFAHRARADPASLRCRTAQVGIQVIYGARQRYDIHR